VRTESSLRFEAKPAKAWFKLTEDVSKFIGAFLKPCPYDSETIKVWEDPDASNLYVKRGEGDFFHFFEYSVDFTQGDVSEKAKGEVDV